MNDDMQANVLAANVGVPVLTGMSMGAYLARPTRPGRFPSVIICPEIFGIVDHIRLAARRLAADGFIAIAPDFHHRMAPGLELGYDDEGRSKGLALLQALRRDEVLDDIEATMRFLRTLPETLGKIAMLGFSAGGHIAYLAATQLDVAAAISFYGGWITNTDIGLSQPQATITLTPGIARHDGFVLYVVGSEDHVIRKDQCDRIDAALSAAGVRHEVVVYPGVKHGFLFDGRPAFDPVASEDAWRRTTTVLTRELAP